MKHSLRRLTPLLMLLAACSSAKQKDADPAVVGTISELEARLSPVAECADLETYLKNEKKAEVRNYFQQLRQRPTAYYAYGVTARAGGAGAVTDGADLAMPTANAESGSASSGNDIAYSETNTQEKGVDEADIVKTDGAHLYVLTQGQLVILRTLGNLDPGAPPSGDTPATTIVSKLELDGIPQEMFVRGDQIVAFSTLYGDQVPVALRASSQAGGTEDAAGATMPPCAGAGDPRCFGGSDQAVQIALIDIRDRAQPRVTKTWVAEAQYNTSRLVGESVRVVLGAMVKGPSWTDEVLPMDPRLKAHDEGKCEVDDAGEIRCPATVLRSSAMTAYLNELGAMERKQLARIEASDFGREWLPKLAHTTYAQDGARSETSDVLAPCAQFWRPGKGGGFHILDVATLQLDAEQPALQHAAIVSQGGVVYASTESLYVVTHPYFSTFWSGWADRATWRAFPGSVHKFDIATHADHAQYVATGIVPGHVLNQFSMDEEGGFVRIATTIEAPAWVGGPVAMGARDIAVDSGEAVADEMVTQPPVDACGRPVPSTSQVDCDQTSSNHLFVLGEADHPSGVKVLTIKGAVRNLACGERIYSARFMGNKGFMVTFRTVDPLFTFDLTDPANPKQLGELKIPGFSEYVHPLDDEATKLLTVGRQADECGRQTGALQLSIFDVADMTNPKQLHTFEIDGWAHSEAEHNHKAFNYFADRKLLAIPVTAYDSSNWYGSTIGMKVFGIDVQTGITPKADIAHSGTTCYGEANDAYGLYRWPASARRALTIGDHFLYVLSDLALTTHVLDASHNVTEAPFTLQCLPNPTANQWYGW
jgi:hypothetical protein